MLSVVRLMAGKAVFGSSEGSFDSSLLSVPSAGLVAAVMK